MTVASYPMALLASMLALSGALGAQVPGSPVLQNAFLNPGLGFAGNLAGGSGQSYYGVAAGWGLVGGRLQLSGAAGAQRANEATRGAYGARGAFNVWTSRGGSIGATAFAGVGGAPRTRSGNFVTNAAVATVPAGASVAYRRALGAKRGISAYASPFYQWTRLDDGDVTTGGTFRVSFGVDFSVTSSIGITAGGELGGNSSQGSGSGLFGAAVTFVPGRR